LGQRWRGLIKSILNSSAGGIADKDNSASAGRRGRGFAEIGQDRFHRRAWTSASDTNGEDKNEVRSADTPSHSRLMRS